MIEFQCPHCERVLRIPEKFAGVEGACSLCGGRILVPSESGGISLPPAGSEGRETSSENLLLVTEGPPEEAIEIIRGNVSRLQTYLELCERNIERLTQELSAESAAKAEAEVARQHAETRALELEEKLAAVLNERNEALARAEGLNRAGTLLAEARAELDDERTARARAEAALRGIEAHINAGFFADAISPAAPKTPHVAETCQPEPPAGDAAPSPEEASEEDKGVQPLVLPGGLPKVTENKGFVPRPETTKAKRAGRGKWIFAVMAGCAILVVAAAGILVGLPVKPVQPPPVVAPVVEPPKTGDLAVSVFYKLALKGKDPQQVPGTNATFVVVRQRFDEESFRGILTESGVAEPDYGAFTEWYRSTFPVPPDAAKAFAGDADAPLAESRKKLADFVAAKGAEDMAGRLRALVSYDEPSYWKAFTASADGTASVKDLEPGNYLVVAAPAGPPESWRPIDPKADLSPDLVTIRHGESTKYTLILTDTVSAINGEVVDAESGKPVPKASLTISGEVSGGKERTIAVTPKGNGSFQVDPRQMGYGEFTVSVTALPKGYVTAATFHGKREPGVPLEPITIQLSKKRPEKAPKKAGIAGRVLNADGTPAPGFTIWKLTSEGSASVARSGGDGAYEAELPPGTAKLYASGPGTARTTTATVEIQPSEALTRDFVIPKCGRIVLTLVAPEGKLPERFEECSLSSPNRVATDPEMIERDGDAYVIPYLVSGSYDLRFRVAGFKPVDLPGLVIDKNASDRSVSVTLEPAN